MRAAEIWKLVFTKEHLEACYNEKIEKKPSVGMDKVSPKKFKEELLDNIDIICRKVNNGTYHFTRYKQLLFTKGPVKPPRTICVPTLRDKLTLSVLNEILAGVYGNKSRTQMPQIIIHDITDKIPKYDCFLKLDVKSFYASIDQNILLKKLKRKIRKVEIISLIEKAVKTSSIAYPVKERAVNKEREKGVPEGLSISNALANIYLMDLDDKYTGYDNIEYWRYVDDILILLNKDDFAGVKKEIIRDINQLGLEVNEKKDEGDVEKGFEYLGYRIYPNFITVRESSVLKIEQSIEDLFREARGGNNKYIEWKLNLKITGFILEEHKYGWLFFYSQITDMSLLFHLDDVAKKLVNRYALSGKVHVKRFVRTYMEMHQALHTTTYIPNLDHLTIEDKRKVLAEIYSLDLSGKSDEKIEIEFRKIMAKEIRDIEKDIQNIS